MEEIKENQEIQETEEVKVEPKKKEKVKKVKPVKAKTSSKLDKTEASISKIWNFIKEEHEFENWILFVLSVVLLVLGLYILIAAASDDNAFADAYFNIANSGWGIFNEPWKVILISSIIVAISVGSLVFCLWPVFKPSFRELKKVTWTSKKTLFTNSLTVLVFIAFLTLLFYLFDFALVPLFELIFK